MKRTLLLALAVLLGACGYKGPLTLPRQPAAASPAPNSSPRAIENPERKAGDAPAREPSRGGEQ